VALAGVLAERRELIDQLGAPVPRERRGDPDVVERALIVEQPEQQRADVRARPVLVPPEPGHHAVRGALVLDLEHRPLARLVCRIESLGDDTVQAGALEPFEPVGSGGAVLRGRGQVDRRLRLAEDGFQAPAALALWNGSEVLVAERQQVPGDEARRRLFGEHLHARRCRVDPKQERLEVERAVAGDDDLPVEHTSVREIGSQGFGELREVAVERLEVTRLRVDAVAVAEDEGAKAIPLGLEQPAVVARQ
jgi:hypothetical protein